MISKNSIRIIYGDNPRQMVRQLLDVIKPDEEIKRGALIGIKPNLVVAKPSSSVPVSIFLAVDTTASSIFFHSSAGIGEPSLDKKSILSLLIC